MPVFCLFTLGRHGNFTAGATDLLCTALALNIELLSIIVCAVLQTSYQNDKHKHTRDRLFGLYEIIYTQIRDIAHFKSGLQLYYSKRVVQ